MVNRYVEVVASESGSGLRQLYIPCFVDGRFTIEEAGVFDLQEQINANASSCDINVIVARYNAGDLTALSRRQGFFGDFTSAPDSYRQALEIVNGFESAFSDMSDVDKCGAKTAFEFLDKIKNSDSASEVPSETPVESSSESEV
jgi:hypothetical protein